MPSGMPAPRDPTTSWVGAAPVDADELDAAADEAVPVAVPVVAVVAVEPDGLFTAANVPPCICAGALLFDVFPAALAYSSTVCPDLWYVSLGLTI